MVTTSWVHPSLVCSQSQIPLNISPVTAFLLDHNVTNMPITTHIVVGCHSTISTILINIQYIQLLPNTCLIIRALADNYQLVALMLAPIRLYLINPT